MRRLNPSDASSLVLCSISLAFSILVHMLCKLRPWFVFRCPLLFTALLSHLFRRTSASSAWLTQVDSSGNSYVAGYTSSFSIDGSSNAGGNDVLLMKFDAAGVHQWTTLHGGTGSDYGRALQAKWAEWRDTL